LRHTTLLPALLALSLSPFTLSAQTPDTPPAPIERSAPPAAHAPSPDVYAQTHRQPEVKTYQPAPGVHVRVSPAGKIQTIGSHSSGVDTSKTELRLDSGIVNISVYHPEPGSLILIDLPGGQVDLVKDGFYTFNATTNTVRVLQGEAVAYPGAAAANTNAAGVKIKQDHALTLSAANAKPEEIDPSHPVDLLPGNRSAGYAHGDGPAYGYAPYPAYGFYGEPYGYPYYAYGGPYWGDPFWGYPYGFGLGFGYYGGFGYRGGFGYGGFRGRR
jgi:hypothetical protein